VEENGTKHILGLWQGATENATVCKELLEDLVARRLDPERRCLVVLDGSKALRAAVEKLFGSNSEVQRCQLHKRRNVKDHLPEGCRADYDRQLRNAYAMSSHEDAKAALEKLFRQLERINPSAARSLEEGMEETLKLHRLGVSLDRRRPARSGEEVPQSERLSRTEGAGQQVESAVALPGAGGLGCNSTRPAAFN